MGLKLDWKLPFVRETHKSHMTMSEAESYESVSKDLA